MKYLILTNIMTPYRRFFYDELQKRAKVQGDEFHVILMAETEPNRNWNYKDYKTEYSEVLKGKTITIDNIFVHINWGVKEILVRYNPDLVICAGSYVFPSVWRALQLKNELNYKVFLWLESHLDETRNYSRLKIRIREFVRKSVLSKFDGFWLAGKLAKEFALTYCNKDAKFIFVPNIIDSQKYNAVNNYSIKKKKDIRTKYRLPFDKKIFLLPARLSKVKGIMEFLNIFKNVKNRDDVVIAIAGDGELEYEINNFVKKNQLNVILLGYKQEKEMLELYSISDLLLLPSLSDPNPLAVIEACWCKLPLLVSKHVGNYPEAVIQGVNGYVFSYENKRNAIKIIEECISNDKRWYLNAGAESFKIANDIYNPELIIPKVVEECRRYAKLGT